MRIIKEMGSYFYPADFTFVCPTEIAAMNAKYDEFQKLNTEVLPVSVDSKYSHKRFVETEPLLKGLKLTIGSDKNHEVSRAFGVLVEEEGVALRGRFVFNPDGICGRGSLDDSVGRNVNELLRQIQACNMLKTGEVCLPTEAGERPYRLIQTLKTDRSRAIILQ